MIIIIIKCPLLQLFLYSVFVEHSILNHDLTKAMFQNESREEGFNGLLFTDGSNLDCLAAVKISFFESVCF